MANMTTFEKQRYALRRYTNKYIVEDRYGFHMPRGNVKTGAILAFNLLPLVTCSPTAGKTCAAGGCYAMRDCFRHGYDPEKNCVLNAWLENTVMAYAHLGELETALTGWFAARGVNQPRFFRIHSSGDFLNEKYAWMWYRIVAAHPETRFLAFTKQWDIVRKVPFFELPNFSLVLSGWTGTTVPDDLLVHYREAACVEHGDVPPADHIECAGHCEQCAMCWSLGEIGKDVFFRKH